MQKDFFFPDEPRWTILLIDMQRDTPGIDTEKKSRLVAYQSKVLEYASTNDIPAVIAEVKGNGATIGELRNIAKNIGRKRTIRKRQEDCFSSNYLEHQLEKWRTNCLYLMGVYAGGCVMETAETAAIKGYGIATHPDAIASIHEEVFAKASEWYKANGIFGADYRRLFSLNAGNGQRKTRELARREPLVTY